MPRTNLHRSLTLAFGSVAAVIAHVPDACANPSEARSYDLPAQPLGDSLRAVSLLSGQNILAPAALLRGRNAPPLRGRYSADEAVGLLIRGLPLQARSDGSTWLIEPAANPQSDASRDDERADIVVTGSRIRGAPVASPLLEVTRQDMLEQGKSNLGQVARSLPQSFGGGQNPGVGSNVPAVSGVDIGGGSSINLRGLGSDATLTLLDGRRLAFTGSRQSIDVSAIPIGAVERIEVVPDGASAIYGSDAVAGVANVILRHKFDGLELGARIASATDGGDFEQQYWATGGRSWTSGGVVAAYEHGSNTSIVGSQRSYAASKPGLTIYPALRHDSGTIVTHQTLADWLTFELDGLYNVRHYESTFPTLPNGDLAQGRATNFYTDRSWVVAPALKFALGAGWRASLAGDVGQEKVKSSQITCTGATCAVSSTGFYRNRQRSAEISGDGSLFALPGGSAKIALGAGYRKVYFERFATNGSAVNTAHDQDSHYAFGELELPLLGEDQGLPLVKRLTATAAVRYERYPGLGGIATPKAGLIWAPTADFDLKASWGKSFRAPTQYQQYQPRAAIIYPPSLLGASGLPASAAALYVQGGNPALRPERASTWSATFSAHPHAFPGAKLEVTYFDVSYRDRIVSPIAFVSQALVNPLFASQITRNPSAGAQAALIAGASTFVNVTGFAYDPTNVIAIVDNASVNAGHQSARGVDVLAEYRLVLGVGQSLRFAANASYLHSSQQISASQPTIPLSGRIFSPPHWRAQGTITYSVGELTLTPTLNYTGGVQDSRTPDFVPVHGMTTIDLTGRVRMAQDRGPLHGVEISVSASNLFNAKPDIVAAVGSADTPYDSTNYAPFGRVLSLGLSKRF
jgi:iron complex outermembrane receptor protein